jgi:hypothetical protein
MVSFSFELFSFRYISVSAIAGQIHVAIWLGSCGKCLVFQSRNYRFTPAPAIFGIG